MPANSVPARLIILTASSVSLHAFWGAIFGDLFCSYRYPKAPKQLLKCYHSKTFRTSDFVGVRVEAIMLKGINVFGISLVEL